MENPPLRHLFTKRDKTIYQILSNITLLLEGDQEIADLLRKIRTEEPTNEDISLLQKHYMQLSYKIKSEIIGKKDLLTKIKGEQVRKIHLN